MALVRDIAVVSAVGGTAAQHMVGLRDARQHNLSSTSEFTPDLPLLLGKVKEELPVVTDHFWPFTARFFSLALAAAEQIAPTVAEWRDRYGADRIGVVVGSSTSGIHAGEAAYRHRKEAGEFPDCYHYSQQEMGALSGFLGCYFGLTGRQYTISTACTSGAKALLSAKRLIDLGVCDAVISGGVDTLCALTVRGFLSLGLVSKQRANPFSAKRDGLNIGEGAALVLLEKEAALRECKGDFIRKACNPVLLAAGGECSDAHHVSAPHPEGRGARVAIEQALDGARITAQKIGYINAHGTGTVLNDAAEAQALSDYCALGVPFSSTKPFTGHTLGAAGAIEAAICILLLQQQTTEVELPVHCWDGQVDCSIPPVLPVVYGQKGDLDRAPYVLSTSFAFGGSNCALLFKREQL